MLCCGVVGAPLFVLAFVIEGSHREGYDRMREPVSSLSLGPRGWTQRANFIGTGALMLAFAEGLREVTLAGRGGARWVPRFVAAYAIGLIGAGVFVTDPVAYGRPEAPTTSPTGATPSPMVPPGPTGLQGALHVAFSMQTFACLSAAAWAQARWFATHGRRRWAALAAFTGALVPCGIIVFGQALGRDDGLGRIAGLIQRLTIGLGWGWLTALGVHYVRRTKS
jgi:Protein of unknown function (DUF998)